MSYEGYEEFLCKNGHYWSEDALTLMYAGNEERKKATTCPCCKGNAVKTCSVDVTNGCSDDEPWSMPGPKNEIGFDDIPMTDHHGNKYFIKELKFEAVQGDRWRDVGAWVQED